MAKVYLESTDTAFTVNNNNTTIYGANGKQTITVVNGVSGVNVDQNIEEVVFEKTSADYTYEQSGNQVKVYLNGVLQAIIPVQGDSDGTQLTFANGSANAEVKSGVMTLGGSKSDGSSSGSLNPATVLSKTTPTPTPNDGGGSPTPTFIVTNTAGVVTFSGTATGNITFTTTGNIATFSRAGVIAATTVDFSSGFSKITVSSGQTLSATAAQITAKNIDGAGGVAVTALESTLGADLSAITATTVGTAVVTALATPAIFTGHFGKAIVTTSGDGILNVDSATIGTATFSVASGATLQGSAAKLGGVSVTGAGSVEVTALGASTNLSSLNSTLNVTATVSSSVDISSNSNLATVDAYSVASGQTLTMTASQADAKSIAGAGGVTITGVAGNETLNIATAGTNSITAGVGADNITLGSGTDTLVYAGATLSTTETHARTFQALTTAGQSVTVDGLKLTASAAITAADIAAGFASLSAGAATGNTVTNGTWSGALSSGWSSGAAGSAAVTFTSTNAGTNVTDITAVSAGISAPTALSDSAIQGAAPVTAANETHTLTFQALTAVGQSVTVDGLKLTASGAITAADVAAGFASLSAGASTGNTVTNGVWSGALSSAYHSGTTSGAVVTFTSETANSNVTDIVFASAGVSTPNVNYYTTPGCAEIIEKNEITDVTFQAMSVGDSVTVKGITLTATSSLTANQVAAGFANFYGGATAGNAVAGGTWSLSYGFYGESYSASGATVTFESWLGMNDDLYYSTTGTPLSVNVIQDGVMGWPSETETCYLTFSQALIANQSITVDGLTLTATGDISAADAVAGFANLGAGAATGNTVTNGTWSGALSSAWHSGAASGTSVTFTSQTPAADVANIAVAIAGVSAPTALSDSAVQGAALVTAANETHALTFQALIANQSVTVDGLTLTATGNISTTDVAAGFASLSASAAAGNAVVNGTWSGTLSSAWHSGTASAAAVTFTSETANSNVADIVFASAGVSDPAAIALSSAQGVAGTASDSPSTGFDVITGFSAFDIIDWSGGNIARASAATATSGTAGLVGDGSKATFDAVDTTFANHLAAVENAIRASSNTAGEAAHWQEGSDAYVFITDGTNGVGAGDILIKLVGVDLTNTANDVITINAGSNLTLA